MTQLSPMMEARAFRIWQCANPRDWDCSYEDIGAAVGMDRDDISNATHAKGWGGRIAANRRGAYYGSGSAKGAAVANIKMGHKFDPNNLDTVDLMSAGIFAGADE